MTTNAYALLDCAALAGIPAAIYFWRRHGTRWKAQYRRRMRRYMREVARGKVHARRRARNDDYPAPNWWSVGGSISTRIFDSY
jgi:hypothetical protein